MKYIKRIIFGGEGYPKAKLKLIYELYSDRTEFINVYGPTECTCICSVYRIKKEDFTDLIGIPPLGKIIDKFDYLILDEKDHKVKADEVGELCLLGANVGKGYYNDQERTRQNFTPTPFNEKNNEIMYRTGDLVKYNPQDKNLYFASRKDYQVKHMGYRIELGEIEHALNTLVYVLEAAALFGECKGFKQIVAVVKLNKDVEETAIKNDLKDIIPDYMIPRKIFKVKELLKNPNGKIDRKKMAETYFNNGFLS
jgi:D-alanine--poly(phosphoribitol) ligase subunit 1